MLNIDFVNSDIAEGISDLAVDYISDFESKLSIRFVKLGYKELQISSESLLVNNRTDIGYIETNSIKVIFLIFLSYFLDFDTIFQSHLGTITDVGEIWSTS